jgi:two-component system chemotaxis response regulator CheY
MRVLIADDQRNVATSLAALVTHCEHEVVAVAGSGLEAIQAFDLHKPDVVLMDYCMAKLNGATACRMILAKDPAARIIFVSAWAPGHDLAAESGAIGLLPKPVDLEKLRAVLADASQMLPFKGSTN